jgi:hypothetical protein
MIVLRRVDGSTAAIPPDVKFIELVNDLDGSVMVVFFQVQPGAILKINPGSADAARYEQLFQKNGVRFQDSMLERRPG